MIDLFRVVERCDCGFTHGKIYHFKIYHFLTRWQHSQWQANPTQSIVRRDNVDVPGIVSQHAAHITMNRGHLAKVRPKAQRLLGWRFFFRNRAVDVVVWRCDYGAELSRQ